MKTMYIVFLFLLYSALIIVNVIYIYIYIYAPKFRLKMVERTMFHGVR